MSTPILPFAMWSSGTNQNSVPANDNSLRNQILNGLVISDSTDAQPGSPDDGDTYIITGAATGAQWSTFNEFDLAIFDSGTWYAFAPVEGIRVNIAGQLHEWDGVAYSVIGGLSDAPSDGTGYVRKNGAWAAESGGGATTVSIITEASTSTMDPATHAGLSRYIRCGDDVTFDNAEGYAAGEVYNIRATAALTLIGTGVTLTAPAGGTLDLDAAMSVTVVMTTSSAGDVIGQTVPL